MLRNQKILTMSAVLVAVGAATIAYYKLKKPYRPLNVFPKVDLNRYLGEWYEIARLPTKFEKGCKNTKANYTLNDDGSIQILNTCTKEDGEPDAVEGKAFIEDRITNAKLKVQFAWPFKGDYWILDIGQEYEYALVGIPSRENLWILSRTPKMNGNSLKKLKKLAQREGFEIDKLIYTKHS